jgi:hypothetical protein
MQKTAHTWHDGETQFALASVPPCLDLDHRLMEYARHMTVLQDLYLLWIVIVGTMQAVSLLFIRFFFFLTDIYDRCI